MKTFPSITIGEIQTVEQSISQELARCGYTAGKNVSVFVYAGKNPKYGWNFSDDFPGKIITRNDGSMVKVISTLET